MYKCWSQNYLEKDKSKESNDANKNQMKVYTWYRLFNIDDDNVMYKSSIRSFNSFMIDYILFITIYQSRQKS